MGLHGFVTAPIYLALAGVLLARRVLYLRRPDLPAAIQAALRRACYRLLDNKYYLDRINEVVFAGGARKFGFGLLEAAATSA